MNQKTSNNQHSVALPRRPRVAICGIHIESSTFTPYLSVAADFEVTRGQQLMERYFWRDYTWASQVDWLPILHARALPGGVVQRAAYDAWKAEIVDGLRQAVAQAPLDGLFFDIHGAMSVEGLDDAEADLLGAIRQVIGPEPLVGASMDLHGNVSAALFADSDMLTCYRLAPHEDAQESRMRAAYNLVARLLSGAGKPAKALVHVPVLLPGEMTSTRLEPAKSLYEKVVWVAERPGVIDAAIWIGFAWADQPRCCAAVAVYGDDAPTVEAACKELGQDFWQVARDFEFVAPTGSFAQCLSKAEENMASGQVPYFISDSGDNPGAGGADDTTHALAQLLDWQPAVAGSGKKPYAIFASIFDRETALAAWDAGQGASVEVTVGGKIDRGAPGPLTLAATVHACGVDPLGGRTVVLRHETPARTVDVIVSENRNQYGDQARFDVLGLEPARADVVVVKIGYLEPDLYAMQKSWMLALTPGGVDQDLVRLGHQKICRPLLPFDPDMADPELQVITE